MVPITWPTRDNRLTTLCIEVPPHAPLVLPYVSLLTRVWYVFALGDPAIESFCQSASPHKVGRVKKPRNLNNADEVSRREFARRVALTVAGGTLAAATLPISSKAAPRLPSIAPLLQDEDSSGLSADAQAEVEAKLQNIFAKYGARFSDDQKKLMRRTVTSHVRMLEAIRPIPVANGDTPATVLKLIDDGISDSKGMPSRPSKEGA